MGLIFLLLQQTLYGTKQAALQFWRELLKSTVKMFYKWSKADPCLFSSGIKKRAQHLDIVGG
jgi:ABC-type thiamine transport system substrate-binding protein